MKDQNIHTTSYPVLGMTCAGCAASVESMISAQNGVKNAAVNYATNRVRVTYQPDLVTPDAFQRALQSVGYDLILDEEHGDEKQEEMRLQSYQSLKKKTVIAAVLTIPVVLIAMVFMHMSYGNSLMLVFTTPVVFYIGKDFFVNAWKQARHRQANMDTLVALSTGIAFLFSVFNTFFPEYWTSRGLEPHVYYETAAVIIVFIMLGKLLEENAKSNTSTAIRKLIGLQAKVVHLVTKDGEQDIPAEEVVVGDVLVVRPGEKIPVDGTVTDESSYVDESMITGEPIAVKKEKNDHLYAGTINQKGSFYFRADKVGKDTLLAHIIQAVQDAQGSKAPVQKLVDKIAGIFVPVVLVIAVITLLAWVVFGGSNGFTQGLMAMVTVLVIACPCALGLATPTAIMVGIGKGAEAGILIKDAEALEAGHEIDTIVLDKTGTLTQGRPVVTEFIWNEAIPQTNELKAILFAIERKSEHPLAAAVVNYLEPVHAADARLTQFESLTGMGVMAQAGDATYFVGNERLVVGKGLHIPENLKIEAGNLQQQARTVVYFTSDQEVICLIAMADQIKEGSRQAVDELKRQGIEVYMLTGDHAATAASVAREAGIEHFEAGVLPSGKSAFIKALQAEGKKVAMVGDGINDSEALAQADLSVAMSKGSDIAMDVAKITLMTSDLRQIPKALRLSKLTVRIIRQNLFWAFIYNLIGIPLAAGLLYTFTGTMLNPMIAGAAMALSSVSVVSNSLRLNLFKL